MAEFVHAKHKGVNGLAYVAKSALEHLEGWEEVPADKVAEEQKKAQVAAAPSAAKSAH